MSKILMKGFMQLNLYQLMKFVSQNSPLDDNSH